MSKQLLLSVSVSVLVLTTAETGAQAFGFPRGGPASMPPKASIPFIPPKASDRGPPAAAAVSRIERPAFRAPNLGSLPARLDMHATAAPPSQPAKPAPGPQPSTITPPPALHPLAEKPPGPQPGTLAQPLAADRKLNPNFDAAANRSAFERQTSGAVAAETAGHAPMQWMPATARVPAELRSIVGAVSAPPRISNPVVEKQLSDAARTLLRPAAGGTVAQSAIDRYVSLNRMAGNTIALTPAIGQDRFRSMLGKLNDAIHSGGYRLVPVTGGEGPPAGDTGTIVINQDANGKTVYVPASQLAGPDKRTIDVNCNDCKVVVVGDNSQGSAGVTDDRHIVVNGSGDQVAAHGDAANGGAGMAGGPVTDNRQISVNGNRDTISAGGDSANGGNGPAGAKGGGGGTIDDNRQVVVNGNSDRSSVGTDRATGGRGGASSQGVGGSGGNGGTIDDNRSTTINGDRDKVSVGGSNVNGGDAGNGQPAGGSGGDGGTVTDHRQVNDAGWSNRSRRGADTANGGNGGSGR